MCHTMTVLGRHLVREGMVPLQAATSGSPEDKEVRKGALTGSDLASVQGLMNSGLMHHTS